MINYDKFRPDNDLIDEVLEEVAMGYPGDTVINYEKIKDMYVQAIKNNPEEFDLREIVINYLEDAADA